MNALVVYESIYGNTRQIAEAVADGLGGATVMTVADATAGAGEVGLLVVGGPTHMHGLATSVSRRMAVEAAGKDGHAPAEPGAAGGAGLRQWLHGLPRTSSGRAAAFDTRLDQSPTVTGMAARGIARRLRRHGYQLMGTESFLVEDSEGPLEEGELERARNWGRELAHKLSIASAA